MGDVAQGTVVKWGATAVSEITSFTGPGLAHDMVDLTDLSDTSMQFLPAGVYDAGEVGLDINFEPDAAIHDQMVDDLIAGTGRVFLMEFQNGTAATHTYTANGYISAFEPGGATGDKINASVTFKLTSALTITTA